MFFRKKKNEFDIKVSMREIEFVPILTVRILSDTHGLDQEIETIIPQPLLSFDKKVAKEAMMSNIAPYIEECMKRAYKIGQEDLRSKVKKLLEED